MSTREADEAQIVYDFVTSFNRAAPDFPLFFKGTLDKAISACWPKNQQKENVFPKMLALYVQKGFGDTFVEFVKCMSSRRMKMILAESYIIWGWDIETPERQSELADLITNKLGEAANSIVDDLMNDPFPKLYLLEKSHDVIKLAHKVSENASEDQMFLEVEAAVSLLVRLSTDKLKPLNLRDKRKSSIPKKETLGDRIETRSSSIAEHQRERRREFGRMSVLGVPPEPAPAEKGVILVKFMAHDAGHERRFSEDDTVDALVNYLISIGYSPESYRFLGKRSRTDIGKVDRGLRLKALQIGNRETINIEPVKNKPQNSY